MNAMVVIMKKTFLAAMLLTALASGPVIAGLPFVLDAQVAANPGGTYSFSVTVAHKDEGWTHYADAWEVLDETGKILATRTLYHPHVDEQPFTRSLARVVVPIGVRKVTLRARDSVHGYGERTITVALPRRK